MAVNRWGRGRTSGRPKPNGGETWSGTETGTGSAPAQLQLLPALSLRLCTDTQSSPGYSQLAAADGEEEASAADALTLSVVAVSEGGGDQRALWEQAGCVRVQRYNKRICSSKLDYLRNKKYADWFKTNEEIFTPEIKQTGWEGSLVACCSMAPPSSAKTISPRPCFDKGSKHLGHMFTEPL